MSGFGEQMTNQEKLQAMDALVEAFYWRAQKIGVHAFIEFCGLMSEYINVCRDAEKSGSGWEYSNTHGGPPLPFKGNHLRYLAEKLDCIYGPAFRQSPDLAKELFPGGLS